MTFQNFDCGKLKSIPAFRSGSGRLMKRRQTTDASFPYFDR